MHVLISISRIVWPTEIVSDHLLLDAYITFQTSVDNFERGHKTKLVYVYYILNVFVISVRTNRLHCICGSRGHNLVRFSIDHNLPLP